MQFCFSVLFSSGKGGMTALIFFKYSDIVLIDKAKPHLYIQVVMMKRILYKIELMQHALPFANDRKGFVENEVESLKFIHNLHYGQI